MGTRTTTEEEKQIAKIYNAALVGDAAEVELGFNSLTPEYFAALSGDVLIEAAIKGHLSVVAKLLEMGAIPDSKDKNGRTPLHFAARSGNITIAERLLASGANINAQDNWGNTILSDAVFESKGMPTMVSFLYKKGADPHIKNNYDISAYDLSRTIANYPTASFFPDKD